MLNTAANPPLPTSINQPLPTSLALAPYHQPNIPNQVWGDKTKENMPPNIGIDYIPMEMAYMQTE